MRRGVAGELWCLSRATGGKVKGKIIGRHKLGQDWRDGRSEENVEAATRWYCASQDSKPALDPKDGPALALALALLQIVGDTDPKNGQGELQ
ncbi:hypothetical protein F5Y03DRAFT_396173 [Xylaria venustula]|nr:hypothetical protein F5Y03DRAFT_396173 [Xylaria venustula]